MAKTRIIVLRRKKLLTVAIPIAALLLLVLILSILSSKKEKPAATPDITPPASAATYKAGVYSSVLTLGDTALNLEVIVDKEHINAVRLVNLDEITAAMYPLMDPSIRSISDKLAAGTPLSEIKPNDSSRYTETLLLQGIEQVLRKAMVE